MVGETSLGKCAHQPRYTVGSAKRTIPALGRLAPIDEETLCLMREPKFTHMYA